MNDNVNKADLQKEIAEYKISKIFTRRLTIMINDIFEMAIYKKNKLLQESDQQDIVMICWEQIIPVMDRLEGESSFNYLYTLATNATRRWMIGRNIEAYLHTSLAVEMGVKITPEIETCIKDEKERRKIQFDKYKERIKRNE